LLILGVVGLIAAILFWFKGRGGLGLEVALLSLASYLVGCCIPCLLGCCGDKKAEDSSSSAYRPVGLMAPRGGKGDDLTKLRMIDTPRAAKLNGLGFYHYDQICNMNTKDREWVWNNIDLKSVAGEGSTFSQWAGWTEACDYSNKAKAVATTPAPVVAAAVAPVAAAAPAPVAAVISAPIANTSAQMAKIEGEDAISGQRPVGYTAARNNKADDLKRIRGIGPQNEGRLHGLGVWHFDQIAHWSHENIEWVGSYLAFPGRIDREEWVSQAKILAAGGETEFSVRADKGEVATSKDDGSKGASNVEIVKPHN
jgi:predicted flap endonuclease-1-like 5' DNA nuclease